MEEIRLIEVKEEILADNKNVATGVREHLRKSKTMLLNLMSSPGSGKTSLILKTAEGLKESLRMGVIEADIDSIVDAEKVAAQGIPAIQLRTGGFCHLDASMVNKGIEAMAVNELDLIIIENVGNLVCPAGFQLGEDMKVVLLSTTEGDDKPGKYPSAFFNAQVMLVTKIDLLPHTNFNLDAAKRDALKINPSLTVFEVSSLKDEGMGDWLDWLMQALEAKRKKREL